MGYLPLDKVPHHLKLGASDFDVSVYTNLSEDTKTCKTGGFFYAYEDSWLDFAVKNEYYEDHILWVDDNGYYYDPSVTLHSVKIDSRRYIPVKSIVSGDSYHNKILIVRDLEDAKNFQKVFGVEIKDIKACEINWKRVKEYFGGFETRLKNTNFDNLQDNLEFSWLRWWYAKSGVIWNFRLIDEIKEIKNYKPPKRKIRFEWLLEGEVYMIPSDKPSIKLNDVLNKNGVVFYGSGSEIVSDAIYTNYIEFHEFGNVLVLDCLRDFDMSLNEVREKYSAIYCKETKKGLLFDIDIIKYLFNDIA